MKKLISRLCPLDYLAIAIICGFVVFDVTGCISPNPAPGTVTTSPTGALVTNPPVPAYIPNPLLLTASNYASGAAGVASLVPVASPWAAAASVLIPIVFGAVGAASGYYAQAKQTGTANSMLTAVIQGVEAATSQPTVTASAVKSAIQSRATAAGVQPALDAVVQANT